MQIRNRVGQDMPASSQGEHVLLAQAEQYFIYYEYPGDKAGGSAAKIYANRYSWAIRCAICCSASSTWSIRIRHNSPSFS